MGEKNAAEPANTIITKALMMAMSAQMEIVIIVAIGQIMISAARIMRESDYDFYI